MENKSGKGRAIVLVVLLIAVIAGAGAVYPMMSRQAEEQAAQLLATAAPTQAPAVTVAPQVEQAEQAQQEPAATPEVAGPVMRNMAADFKAYDDAGNAVTLREQRGKPVVVTFFASWCGPCKMEMPYFDEFYKTYGEQVTFMMVNLCAFGNDTKENGKKMVEEGGWTFPVYFDTDGDAALKYAIRSMPTTIFVDAQGELKGRHTGVIPRDALEKTIQGMLAQ